MSSFTYPSAELPEVSLCGYIGLQRGPVVYISRLLISREEPCRSVWCVCVQGRAAGLLVSLSLFLSMGSVLSAIKGFLLLCKEGMVKVEEKQSTVLLCDRFVLMVNFRVCAWHWHALNDSFFSASGN